MPTSYRFSFYAFWFCMVVSSLYSIVNYYCNYLLLYSFQPTREKIRTINNTTAPAPTNVSQLKLFLGSINYCFKPLPNLSTTVAPIASTDHCKRRQSGNGELSSNRLSSCQRVIGIWLLIYPLWSILTINIGL